MPATTPSLLDLRAPTRVLLASLLALAVSACDSPTDAVDDPTPDIASPSDTAGGDVTHPDTGGPEVTEPDAGPGAVEDTGAPDAVEDTVEDTGEPDTVDDTTEPDTVEDVADDMAEPDAFEDVADDTAEPDEGPEVVEPEIAPAELLAEDQTLEAPFDTLVVAFATNAEDATAAGKLEVVDGEGEVISWKLLAVGNTFEDEVMELDRAIVGAELLTVRLMQADGAPALDVAGDPLEVTLTAIGDDEDPVLVVNSQDVDPGDLYGLTIAEVSVPARFKVGVWVAVYEDDDGAPGALRGKQKFLPGQHTDVAFATTNKLTKAQTLWAVMREPIPFSGGWTSSGAVITTLSGQDVATSFYLDGEPYQPVVQIVDQTLEEPDEILVEAVTVPQEFIGGGWLAVHADADGAPGEILGKKYFTKGSKTNQKVNLDEPLEGEHTLHAALYGGQFWDDAQDAIMTGPSGAPLWVTFIVGGPDLSYILAPPTMTRDPRHVTVQRAYSFHKQAWIVLARDDDGEPGEIVATKRVLPKFAGNVHFTTATKDFEYEGTAADYLTGVEGTFREYVRGDETLHVLMYEDDPLDNEFTWTPGGAEDVPVLDASGEQVSALLEVDVDASIVDAQSMSSRYYLPCPLSQHYNNPTTLPVDCRCHVNIETLDFPECKQVIADSLGMQFGEGPRMRTQNFGVWRSGFVEEAQGELIALGVWKDNLTFWEEIGTTLDVGVVMGIDYETRERRIIGGRYDDPETGITDIGTGPVLSHPFAIQKGPDGQYYVASYGYVKLGASLTPTVDVIRMDPDTGNREYVWRSNHLGYNLDAQPNPYGHCAHGRDDTYGYYSVQIGRKGFGIDEAGNFYFSYAHNGYTPTSDGIGILKVGADGSTCDFVTRTKVGADNVLYAGASIGAGPEPQAGPYKGLLVRDGSVYVTTELTDALWKVDIATGDRTALSTPGVDGATNGSSGTHLVWDAHRDLIWQAGFSSMVMFYDEAEDHAEPLWCPENYRDYKGINCFKASAFGNNGLMIERGFWIHPTNPDYAFVVNAAMIQRLDIAAGTSEIFSF